MHVTQKLTRPLTEAKYLNAENADRYRTIMRIFYENYEKLNYWMYPEDVYEQMRQDIYFQSYTMEQCQQDLGSLAEWKNLLTIQDTRKVSSIEEFKNKKYRYQMSEYSVEIERLVIRLENLLIEGASLEPTLLERIRRGVEKFWQMAAEDEHTVYTWWNDLNNDFIRLYQNYQDYMRDLNSVRAESMMRTREFLVFKDKLIEYLRNFIKGLQQNVGVIEETLRGISPELVETVLGRVNDYELSIPRMDAEMVREAIEEKNRGRFASICRWFVSENGGDNEAGKLFDATNEIIRRITRYAALLSEKNALGANRRQEYKKAAELFLKCDSIEQAHKMSAMVFGLGCPYHLKSSQPRQTDSMNTGVYEDTGERILLRPRTRTYKEKTQRSVMSDSAEKKRELKARMLREMAENQVKLKALENDGKIDFSGLPVIEPKVRDILLKWLSDALEDGALIGKTQDGRSFVLEMGMAGEKCVVRCTDGDFTMPHMVIKFQEDVN